MDHVRHIIDSDKLLSLFDLPQALRARKVEVIILPTSDPIQEIARTSINDSCYGSLHKYANPDFIDLETGVWASTAVRKHAES